MVQLRLWILNRISIRSAIAIFICVNWNYAVIPGVYNKGERHLPSRPIFAQVNKQSLNLCRLVNYKSMAARNTCVYVYFSPFCSNMSKRCQKSDPHAHMAVLPAEKAGGRALVKGNTINRLIAMYFLLLLTNKRFSNQLFTSISSSNKQCVCEVAKLIFLT